MREVYRARDTRLERTVAVKILPTYLSNNPEARQRFEREAKVISSLQHPNICTLYDIGSQDGVDFLVMEYLEGEILQDCLLRGALPLERVTRHTRHLTPRYPWFNFAKSSTGDEPFREVVLAPIQLHLCIQTR